MGFRIKTNRNKILDFYLFWLYMFFITWDKCNYILKQKLYKFFIRLFLLRKSDEKEDIKIHKVVFD